MDNKKPTPENTAIEKNTPAKKTVKETAQKPKEQEIGGFEASGLPEPTRFGDWEVKGRCSDF